MKPERVAVIAHAGKSLGGGLDELRRLVRAGSVAKPLWYEVSKSRKAPKKVREALAKDADLIFVWGGDGMVQRCIDAAVGSEATIAIVPAGTANLLAHNLGIPQDLGEAVRIGFGSNHRRLDVGRIKGEHFAVMAGIGFDADMIAAADGGLKDRMGRLAYIWTGLRAVDAPPVQVRIKVDGEKWFRGEASCVLFGNVAKVFGNVEVFDGVEPDDGRLAVGVSTARGPAEWARALARIGTGPSAASPFVEMTRARRVTVKLATALRYELDGGARTRVSKAKVLLVPSAIAVCVPGLLKTSDALGDDDD